MAGAEDTILEIIAKKAKVEPSTLNRATPMSSLAIDSLDVVEIIFDIEEAFDIALPYNANDAGSAEGAGFGTAGDVIDAVLAQIGKQNAHS